MSKPQNNIALIDEQNLHLGTKTDGWVVDRTEIRVHLAEKYGVKEAHYFIGYFQEENDDLYINLQKSGYLMHYKAHYEHAISQKKGNVDSDIIFFAMQLLVEKEDFDKLVLVSGDGDYFDLAKYFIKKQKFEKILFPSRNNNSSLYDQIGERYCAYLIDNQSDIIYKKL